MVDWVLAAYVRIKRGLGDAITNETYGPVIETIGMFLRAGEQDHTKQADRPLDLILGAFRA